MIFADSAQILENLSTEMIKGGSSDAGYFQLEYRVLSLLNILSYISHPFGFVHFR